MGTKGFASLVGGSLNLSFLDGTKQTVAAEGKSGSGASIMDFPHDAHRAVIADFVEAISTGRQPLVSGDEALESQRLVSTILAAGEP
jgi:predicted dehydrogenase